MSLIVSWRAGQMRRAAALLAGDGELRPLAAGAVALAAVGDVAVGDVPVAGAGMGCAQLTALAAMAASTADRVGQGTRTMITSMPSPPRTRRAWHPQRLHRSPLGWRLAPGGAWRQILYARHHRTRGACFRACRCARSSHRYRADSGPGWTPSPVAWPWRAASPAVAGSGPGPNHSSSSGWRPSAAARSSTVAMPSARKLPYRVR